VIPSRAAQFAASLLTVMAAGCVSGARAAGDWPSLDRALPPPLDASTASQRNVSNAVTAISAGHDVSCALFLTGAVSCWGRNSGGYSPTPSRWMLPLAVQVSAYSEQVCIRTLDKRVLCGRPEGGLFEPTNEKVASLGNSASSASAVSEAGNLIGWFANGRPWHGHAFAHERATHVADGSSHWCARLESGRIMCGGKNGRGQLGDGTTTDQWERATEVVDITDAIDVTVGSEFSCALTQGGSAMCWGDNQFAQLGTRAEQVIPAVPPGAPSPPTYSATPRLVEGVNEVVQLSAGSSYACAMTRAGSLYCWGSNWQGQLGHSRSRWPAYPQLVRSVPTAAAVSAGIAHTCMLATNGEVICWGANSHGESGAPPGPVAKPTRVFQ